MKASGFLVFVVLLVGVNAQLRGGMLGSAGSGAGLFGGLLGRSGNVVAASGALGNSHLIKTTFGKEHFVSLGCGPIKEQLDVKMEEEMS